MRQQSAADRAFREETRRSALLGQANRVLRDVLRNLRATGLAILPAGQRSEAQGRRRAVDRSQKEKLVDQLHTALSDTVCFVITHQSGMTVAEVTGLRRQMRDAGANFKVTKNRLARLALKGTKFERLSPLFTGPTAIAFSRDPVAAAKVAVEFANKNDKLSIVGGALGEQQLDVEGVKSLATMPSLDELRARLLGMLQTPATRIASLMQAPGAQLARVFAAYGRKGEAA
jgi:large subunit ribosomal protein L10